MSKLKIAIQKKGRLSEKSINLLKECGIKFPDPYNKLKTVASNFPIEILFLRDDDIPQYVEQNVVDIGILGENEVLEKEKDVNIIKKLGFGNCRVSLAIPKNENYTGLEFFKGKKIATSYPNILQKFFDEKKINANIEELSGSVEIAPSIGLADAVFDIVSTGETLSSNGLKEIETVLKSEAVIIKSNNTNPETQKIIDKLLFRIQAVINSKENKYILLNAPKKSVEKIISILPGMKSPTILPLAESDWYSIHTVIAEERFWEIIDELKNVGAEGILVIPIEKMVI